MTSIREIARLAGVSPATVSRVINNTVKVDPATRARVEAAIRATNYQPNEIARSLVSRSSRLIGLVVPNIINPFFHELAQIIEREAFQDGYRVILCNSDEDEKSEKEAVDMLRRLHADGLIMIGTSPDIVETATETPLPIVLLDRGTGQAARPLIRSDHYAGGKLAIRHLLRCGCRRPVHLTGPLKYDSARLRCQAFEDFCQLSGIEPLVFPGDYQYETSIRQARLLLREHPGTDGIFTANDLAAMAVLKACSEAGIRVPDDLQVIGYDGIALSEMATPSLTTIVQPVAKIGRLAVRRILAEANAGKPGRDPVVIDNPDILLPVSLARRQTTKWQGGNNK